MWSACLKLFKYDLTDLPTQVTIILQNQPLTSAISDTLAHLNSHQRSTLLMRIIHAGLDRFLGEQIYTSLQI